MWGERWGPWSGRGPWGIGRQGCQGGAGRAGGQGGAGRTGGQCRASRVGCHQGGADNHHLRGAVSWADSVGSQNGAGSVGSRNGAGSGADSVDRNGSGATALLALHWTKRTRGDELLNKVTVLFSLHRKSVLVASLNSDWTTDGRWSILTMLFILFWASAVPFTWQSMGQSQASRFSFKIS